MTAPDSSARLHVAKGHGTQNDFVLLDGRTAPALDEHLVRALADRRTGIGADGVIRLTPAADLPEGRTLQAEDTDLVWFMDYRNADGSVAQMCGNGVRVTARYAEALGLWNPADGDLVLGTRAGVRRVRRMLAADGSADTWYTVDMGVWHLPGGEQADADGFDTQVVVAGLDVPRPGLRVDVGNPHTVLALPDQDELAAADLTTAPHVEPVPADGTNVELVVPLGEMLAADGSPIGRVRMRVHERGVGETRSCGTGACAAALAVRTWAGPTAPDLWLVDVPGGTLQVTARPDGHVELAGPAVLVADLDVDPAALAR